MMISGCKSENDIEMESPETATKKQYTYLALGDSYTIGEGVKEEDRFPNIIIGSINKKHNFKGEVNIIATTGWRTDQLINAVNSANLEPGDFDFITLLIGVNNQYQGAPLEKFEQELDSLISMSIELMEGANDKIILISIPDYGVTPFASSRGPEKIEQEINTYNDIKKAFSEKYEIPYVYITDLTRLAKNELSLLASDQLHPSGILYRQWVERILPEVEKILGL